MIHQGPGWASLLWTVLLLQGVLGFCDRPGWTGVLWDMTQEDLAELTGSSKDSSNCLHDSICKICHTFSGLTLSKGCLEILYVSCKLALFLFLVLSLQYLLPKLKKTKDIKPSSSTDILVTTETHEEYTYNTAQMLCRLVVNTTKMMKYMKHMARHQKEVKNQKSNKKRKADNIDEEQFFPVCPHKHSSSEDTIMHEV